MYSGPEKRLHPGDPQAMDVKNVRVCCVSGFGGHGRSEARYMRRIHVFFTLFNEKSDE